MVQWLAVQTVSSRFTSARFCFCSICYIYYTANAACLQYAKNLVGLGSAAGRAFGVGSGREHSAPARRSETRSGRRSSGLSDRQLYPHIISRHIRIIASNACTRLIRRFSAFTILGIAKMQSLLLYALKCARTEIVRLSNFPAFVASRVVDGHSRPSTVRGV